MTTLCEPPLLQTARLGRTEYWNDSCAVDGLAAAIGRGATGATSNPWIALADFGAERAHWVPRVRELAAANPVWNETELAWAVIKEMGVRGAAVLRPVFEREKARKGWQAVQVDPANYRDPARMAEQAARFAGLAPNIGVKIPVTAAGLVAIEEAASRGISTAATISFTVAQAVAAAEAAERGLDRLARAGGDPARLAPVSVIMMGRLDDWLKNVVDRGGPLVDPGSLDWAGLAVMKRAYAIFKERGYRSRLLAAAYRNRLHWTELVGGDLAMTITPGWQARFNDSGIVPAPRMDVPVDPDVVAELCRIPDFLRAYDPAGLAPAEFDGYAPTVRTLRTYTAAVGDLAARVRDIMLPDPDRPAREP